MSVTKEEVREALKKAREEFEKVGFKVQEDRIVEEEGRIEQSCTFTIEFGSVDEAWKFLEQADRRKGQAERLTEDNATVTPFRRR
jgi:hypothetical protein